VHASVLAWFCDGALTGPEIAGQHVLEVGAYNVNGSVRPIVEALAPASYLGVDMAEGPGVDKVVDATELALTLGVDRFDVVLSTECLEHAEDWRAVMANMATVLKPGGLLVLTTRSPGFPRHDFPSDHWRFTAQTMSPVLTAVGFGEQRIQPDPDRASPGIFVKARKTMLGRLDLAALAAIEVAPAPPPP
jgi:SAM-dependent methyltransferase